MTVPTGWQPTKLGDFVDLQRGFDLPKTKRIPGPYKVLSSGVASGSHNEGPVNGPGFVIGRATNLGRPTWSDEDYWPLNTVLFVKDFKGNDPRFAYYVFENLDLTGYNSGSVQPMLNRNYIAGVELVIPLPNEQRGIAATLRALDDKIESNRRTIGLTSSLARAYVDAMTTGRTRVPAADVLQVRMGSAFKGEFFSTPGSGRPLLRIRDLKTFSSQTWTTESRADETVIGPGDIVVGMDAEFRVTVWLGIPSVLNQRVCSFVGKNGVGRAYVLAALEPELARQEASKTGTTVIHLNKGDIDTFEVPLLSADEHAALSELTEPLIDVIVARSQENRSIRELREVLLRELLSGRLRVPEAAKVVQELLPA